LKANFIEPPEDAGEGGTDVSDSLQLGYKEDLIESGKPLEIEFDKVFEVVFRSLAACEEEDAPRHCCHYIDPKPESEVLKSKNLFISVINT